MDVYLYMIHKVEDYNQLKYRSISNTIQTILSE
jgi:hypothetical protein